MSFIVSFKTLTIFAKIPLLYVLDYALTWPLTPVLASSNSKEFFQVTRSDDPIIWGLKYNLDFLKGSFIPRSQFSRGGVFSGTLFWSLFPSVENFKGPFSSAVSYN